MELNQAASPISVTHFPRPKRLKRYLVGLVLQDKEVAQWSDSRIARLLQLSQPFVAECRKEHTGG